MTESQASLVLDKGEKLLGESMHAPAYAGRLTRTPPHKQPTAYGALFTTMAMLDVLKSLKPEVFERFMQRDDTIYPVTRIYR